MFLIIQNDPEVPPGLVARALDRLRADWRVVHSYRGEKLPQQGQLAAVIVLGGAMGANDDARFPFLIELKGYIRDLVAGDVPYLGICLGGQLLAASLGAPVVSQRWEEVGSLTVTLSEEGRRDPLFAGISDSFTTFQWHHDSFDLPAGSRLLAGSDACPHQAFRVGERAWGVQFHPEVNGEIIGAWCAGDPTQADRSQPMLAEWQAGEPDYQWICQRLIENFVTLAGRAEVQPK